MSFPPRRFPTANRQFLTSHDLRHQPFVPLRSRPERERWRIVHAPNAGNCKNEATRERGKKAENEVPTAKERKWWRVRDSDPRQTDYDSVALPTELTRRNKMTLPRVSDIR